MRKADDTVVKDPFAVEARLSQVLRQATAAIHSETEQALQLPQSIRNGSDYRELLERFYQIYAPLEKQLAGFAEWSEIGIAAPGRTHSEWLACDLRALGVNPEALPWATDDCLPDLPSFAHALGAKYVLQGSTLGSQVILGLLSEAIGPAMRGADTFLRGHGASTRDRWVEFCVALDRYGDQPSAKPDPVIAGARSTFAAIGFWMKPGMKPGMSEGLQAAYAGGRSHLRV